MKRNGLSLKSRTEPSPMPGPTFRPQDPHCGVYRTDVAGYRVDSTGLYRSDLVGAQGYRTDMSGYRVDASAATGLGYRGEPQLGYRDTEQLGSHGYREHAHAQFCYDQNRGTGNGLQSLLTIADPHAHAWAKCHSYVSAGAH